MSVPFGACTFAGTITDPKPVFCDEQKQTLPVEYVSYDGFVALMQYVYTNTFDETVAPLHLAEVIRCELVSLIVIQFSCVSDAWCCEYCDC